MIGVKEPQELFERRIIPTGFLKLTMLASHQLSSHKPPIFDATPKHNNHKCSKTEISKQHKTKQTNVDGVPIQKKAAKGLNGDVCSAVRRVTLLRSIVPPARVHEPKKPPKAKCPMLHPG